MDYVEMVERIKERYQEEASGGCRMLSLGDGCECTLCLADNLRRHITELETRATSLETATRDLLVAKTAKGTREAFKKLREVVHRRIEG